MTYSKALGLAATFTLLAFNFLSGCSTNSPGGSVGTAGKTGNDASAGAGGSGGGAGLAGGGGSAGDNAAGGSTGQAGTGGHDAGMDVAMTDGGPNGAPDAATVDAQDAGAEAAPLATPAMIKATCSMYAAGTKALSAADFCTLFQDVCVNFIDYEPLTGCFAGESGPILWASTYNTWTMSQKDCRSQHLCAAAAGSASTECRSAQGVVGNTCK